MGLSLKQAIQIIRQLPLLFRNLSRLAREVDWYLLIIPWLLSLTGLVILYGFSTGQGFALFSSQLIFIVIGVLLQFSFCIIDYRNFRTTAPVLYVVGMLLLLLVLMIGKTTGGATRWLDLGLFLLQPSELMKLLLVLVLSRYIIGQPQILAPRQLLNWLALLALPAGLTLLQPDFGSAAILLTGAVATLISSRFSRAAWQAVGASFLLVIVLFGLSYAKIGPTTGILKEYQRARISSFIHPTSDPYGGGYNVRQSLIAVGSGGLLGKGLGAASQSELKFLPVPHTDFIFASTAETFGFVGAVGIIFGYLIILVRLLSLARGAEDRFGSIVAYGIAGVLFFEATINIGMNVGLLPVTGVPLPFLSHGGSQTITSYIMLGIAQSIHRRRNSLHFS